MKPSSLHHPPPKISTSCAALDRFLHGGVPTGQITELVSESGCGKTQLCLQLSLSSPSLYLHSEFPFPLRRLTHLSLSSKPTSQNPLDRIFIRPVYSADQLLDVLLKLDPILSNPENKYPFKLIIVDSIAALFRSEFDNTGSDLKKRASLFFKISGKLRAIASKFGVAIVVTNQVVDVVGENCLRIGNFGKLFSSGRDVSPALGLSWANCVNSRIFLSREEVVVREENGSENVDLGGDKLVKFVTKRQLHVVFSPYLPKSACEFVILRDGIFGVDNNAMILKNTP